MGTFDEKYVAYAFFDFSMSVFFAKIWQHTGLYNMWLDGRIYIIGILELPSVAPSMAVIMGQLNFPFIETKGPVFIL